MCIVQSNLCNVIVGVFVCSVYFIMSVELPPVSPFLFINYVISRGALHDAPRITRALRNPSWETPTYGHYFVFPFNSENTGGIYYPVPLTNVILNLPDFQCQSNCTNTITLPPYTFANKYVYTNGCPVYTWGLPLSCICNV